MPGENRFPPNALHVGLLDNDMLPRRREPDDVIIPHDVWLSIKAVLDRAPYEVANEIYLALEAADG